MSATPVAARVYARWKIFGRAWSFKTKHAPLQEETPEALREQRDMQK
jgi:hypothetical protein